jgi:hypothetical protein
MSTSAIRAVEMIRNIRNQLVEETQGLSAEEFKAFIAREAQKVAEQPKHSRRRPAA